jgi:hypothetical protein
MLPKIQHQLFEIEIPSLKKKVQFRPFLVKEEKILLIAAESDDDGDIIRALLQIINNCAQEDIDLSRLAIFDIEYVFLKLRAKSVDNIIELAYEDLEDGEERKFKVNLNDIELVTNEKHTNIIDVTDSVKMKMKYPTSELAAAVESAKTELEFLETMLVECVDSIYDDETVYDSFSEEELKEFLDNLDSKTHVKIKEFFETMPRLYHAIEYTNKKGTERKIELKTVTDFFTLG